MYDVCIIGCGVIGAAAAFELSKHQADVLILEKENDVSETEKYGVTEREVCHLLQIGGVLR